MSANALATAISIRPVSPQIGAEIDGVDLTQPLDDPTFSAIRDAFHQYQVLFFRDQRFDHQSQKAFGRRFGNLHVHPASPASDPEHPEILRIHADGHSRRVAGEGWHSDVSCEPRPPLGSILYLHTLPETGGDTLFASTYAAYDALSPQMKQYLAGLTARHDGNHVYRRIYRQADTEKVFPKSDHPVVRTHPVTGRKGLFVNSGFTTRINGLPKEESAAVLAFLYRHIARPEFQARFRWQPHSVAFWDNRCAQHMAIWDYFPQVRSGYRVTIDGDEPF